LSSDHPEYPEDEILRRVKAMTFSCIYCNENKPVALTAMDYQPKGSGPHVVGFFICPDCQNKYMVKIEDLGRVGYV
jgi:transcription elongation factor Elf1